MVIENPRVDADSLRGFRRESLRPVSIGLSTIDFVAVKEVDRFKTTLAALGGAGLVGIVLLAVDYVRGYTREL